MDIQIALDVFSAFIKGTHPTTGEIFPENHVLQEAEIVRALFVAHALIAEEKQRRIRKERLPAKTGKNWEKQEEEELLKSIERGVPFSVIATNLQRSRLAIQMRVEKLQQEKIQS
jgi:CRISPR/Cas system-associated endonuclease Cas3-HD